MNTERPTRPAHVIILAASVLTAHVAIAQNGVLDVTFSGDGQLGFMPQLPDVITVDILETGGKIFPILSAMNGTTSSFILKLNEEGSLDSGFDADGILEFPNAGIDDAALARDGSRIFILASAEDGYRIGSIDLSGVMLQPWTEVEAEGGAGFAKMLVDDQGRICIGKGAYIDGQVYGQVIRLNADFTVDETFGTNGVAYTPEAPFSYPLMEIDNAGRIVLASYGLGAAVIWRFQPDGTIDASFSYTLDMSSYSLDNWILDIAIAQDNSIYVQPNTWAWPSYLFKLLENGSVDTGFGTGGHMILTDPEPLWYTAPDELLIEPNGGLIVLAQAYGPDGYMSGKYLTRLDGSGVIDTEFNPGIQTIDDNGFNLRINFHCATLQEDGKVLSMDQVVKWQNGELFGYAPLITRFKNEKGALTSVNEAGPRVKEAFAFPNPTQGSVTLRAPEGQVWRNAHITITNSMGAVLRDEALLHEHIDLAALSAGIYFCRVEYPGGSLQARIIKE